MMPTFNRVRDRGINWRREMSPLLLVAGLAADYLSPPELWTMLLPFGAIVALIALRKWAYAAAVFVLCSWVLIPVAAGTLTAVEDSRGQHRLYVVEGANLPTLDEAALDPCGRKVTQEALPIGPDHVINPRWAMRRAIETFADLHNAMVLDRVYESSAGACAIGDAD